MLYNISITDAAKNAVYKFKQSDPNFANMPLRLYLSAKGCDGFEYGISFDDRDDVQDEIFLIAPDIHIICDFQTLEFVNESEIDWVDDERGAGFLVHNPNHKKFRGKFFKKSVWKERKIPISDSRADT